MISISIVGIGQSEISICLTNRIAGTGCSAGVDEQHPGSAAGAQDSGQAPGVQHEEEHLQVFDTCAAGTVQSYGKVQQRS